MRHLHDRDRRSPPFTPPSFAHLLARDAPRAAAILAAMSPPLRAAQAQAHAALVGATADQVRAIWRTLMRSVVLPCPPTESAVHHQQTKGA